MKRILQVLTTLNRGGAETMVMNYYRALDKTKYQFDFLVHYAGKGDFEDEILSLGGHIFRTIPIRPWSYLAYIKDLDKFFRVHAGEFIAVHAHIQENSCFALRMAEKYGIKHRVSTSHAANPHMDYKFVFRKFAMWYGQKSITDRLACGQIAGVCLYGKDSNFTVMHNLIDVQRFVYNSEVRTQMRKEKGWGNRIVIGHVARFGYPKNHTFIVDVFAEFLKLRSDALLVFVGEGPDMAMIKKKVQQLGIEQSVCFEGLQQDVPAYLSSFDLLIHPSLYEGLPLSIIEAQAAGLRCLLSDTIDKATNVTGNVYFLSLSETAESWAKQLNSLYPYQRSDTTTQIKAEGYDVYTEIGTLLALYEGQ